MSFHVMLLQMETNKTYDDILLDLTKQLTEVEDWNGWRDNIPILTTMPFFESKFYPEYFGYAADIWHWMDKSWQDGFGRWKRAMSANPSEFSVWANWDLFTWNLKDIRTSTWHIKSNHHYFRYYTLTGIAPNDFDRIVEVGAGCGDMCKFVLDMGFSGEYVIVDLPEVQEVQKHNLRDYSQVNWTTEPVQYDPKKRTLFISTWALSELTLAWRQELVDALKPEHYLIAYQREFEDIDNEAWFSEWEGYREELPWIHYDGGTEYIMK